MCGCVVCFVCVAVLLLISITLWFWVDNSCNVSVCALVCATEFSARVRCVCVVCVLCGVVCCVHFVCVACCVLCILLCFRCT